jgi:serine dehydrogenase proteinase
MRCRGSLIALATDEIVMSPNAAFELPVSTDTPADVYGFMELLRQPRERIPSAQYIPILARQRGGQQIQ